MAYMMRVNMSNIIRVTENVNYAGMSMSQRLRAARIAAGFESASAAARALSIPISTYSAHENGQNDFGPSEAAQYANVFKSKARWLLLGETDPVEGEPDGPAPTNFDAQIAEFPPEIRRRIIDRFNAFIDGVKIVGKIK